MGTCAYSLDFHIHPNTVVLKAPMIPGFQVRMLRETHLTEIPRSSGRESTLKALELNLFLTLSGLGFSMT
jgi:hypothetical protein